MIELEFYIDWSNISNINIYENLRIINDYLEKNRLYPNIDYNMDSFKYIKTFKLSYDFTDKSHEDIIRILML